MPVPTQNSRDYRTTRFAQCDACSDKAFQCVILPPVIFLDRLNLQLAPVRHLVTALKSLWETHVVAWRYPCFFQSDLLATPLRRATVQFGLPLRYAPACCKPLLVRSNSMPIKFSLRTRNQNDLVHPFSSLLQWTQPQSISDTIARSMGICS